MNIVARLPIFFLPFKRNPSVRTAWSTYKPLLLARSKIGSHAYPGRYTLAYERSRHSIEAPHRCNVHQRIVLLRLIGKVQGFLLWLQCHMQYGRLISMLLVGSAVAIAVLS